MTGAQMSNDSTLTQSVGEPCVAYFSRIHVGGISVLVSGEFSTDLNLDPTVRPFRVESGGSDITLQVRWVSRLSQPRGLQLFDSGCVWRLYENGAGFLFDFGAGTSSAPYKRLLVDKLFREAVLLLSREFFENHNTVVPLEYPLDELLIMHRLTQEQAIELHGVGIVGPNGASNLFVGHSGAGKSTTARLWSSLHEVEILSDDRIIVREDKLREHSNPIFMYGTPWHGEANFALPQRAPLQRIFVLEHGLGNILTRLTRSQAVAELFARSFVPFHRHEYVESALSFLERVADSVPCYRYSFEPDQRAVEKILNVCD